MKIEFVKLPTNEQVSFLRKMLNEELPKGIDEYAFFVRDANNEIIGGCNGFIVLNNIYTDQLWVHKDHRKHGWGKKLLEQSHDYGRSLGCTMATVSTLNIQGALGFYQKLGYNIDFERKGYSDNASVFFLHKML